MVLLEERGVLREAAAKCGALAAYIGAPQSEMLNSRRDKRQNKHRYRSVASRAIDTPGPTGPSAISLSSGCGNNRYLGRIDAVGSYRVK
jgi:hypothetical protein